MSQGSQTSKFAALTFAIAVATGLYAAASRWLPLDGLRELRREVLSADASGVVRSIFSPKFPQNEKFKAEMELLLNTRRLDAFNGEWINKLVQSTSGELSMPPGVLWCLLFQESRFDHLTGLHENRRAKGLGQFAYFSFYEVNHNLERYTKDNLTMFQKVIGWDPRPIAPLRDQISAPPSYYYIPTAVASSAAFLNNRYLQLRRVLEKKQITYSDDVLWFYSAMAYNKGTRSVLSFWNKSLARGGRKEVERLVLEPGKLFDSLDHRDRFVQSLAHIWPRSTAERYAEELTRHMKQIKECSVDPELAKQMESATRGGRRR